MKASVLKRFGSKLAIETMPDPALGTGEVIVDVVATRVLSYANAHESPHFQMVP
jgi:alcohol dehydrogenase